MSGQTTGHAGKTALILGVSGQDGSYLAHLLLSKGYRVHGTSRDAEVSTFANLDALGIRKRVVLHSAALSDFRSVLTVIRDVSPDEIYNLGGQTSVGLSFQQPVETFESVTGSTLNILECIRFSGVEARLFNAVSSDCFGETAEPANEQTPFRPRSPYGMAKAAAFWAGRTYREAYGMFVSSGILANHESPLRPRRFVTRKIVSTALRIAQGSDERLVLGNIEIERDWGLAAEYVEAMWLTLQGESGDDYVIATGQTRSLRDFINAVFGALDLDPDPYVSVDKSFFRPLDLSRSALDPSRIHQSLGWRARTGLDALAAILVKAERDGGVGPLPWAPRQG